MDAGLPPSITTTGHGAVAVPRDTARLDVGLEVRAAGVAEAFAGVQSAQAAAVGVLLRFVAREQVATQGLQVHPDWSGAGDGTGPQGYVGSHALRAGGLAVDVVPEVVATLAAEVGDPFRLHGVELVPGDVSAARTRARELAVADAREKAEHLAALTGTTLGDVVSVVEGAPDHGGAHPAALAKSHGDAGSGSVEGGEADVVDRVTVTWAVG